MTMNMPFQSRTVIDLSVIIDRHDMCFESAKSIITQLHYSTITT